MIYKKKIKVNFINNLFWLAPKISTYFIGRQFGYIPYKTLKDLIVKNDLLESDFIFSLNGLGEKNYVFFNTLFQLRKFEFRLSKEVIYKIIKYGYVDDNSIHKLLVIRWDSNSLKFIKKGYIPFYSKDWYIKKFIDNKNLEKHEKIIINWNEKEFNVIN